MLQRLRSNFLLLYGISHIADIEFNAHIIIVAHITVRVRFDESLNLFYCPRQKLAKRSAA